MVLSICFLVFSFFNLDFNLDFNLNLNLTSLLQRFEHSLQVGDLTIRNFSPQIRDLLMQRFNIDEIRAKMKKDSGAKTRTEDDYKLWDEFKTQGQWSRAEQSREEQSRTEQNRAEQTQEDIAFTFSFL